MCLNQKPDIDTPKPIRAAQAPEYEDNSDAKTKGRRGTLLADTGAVQSTQTAKKTLLGQ